MRLVGAFLVVLGCLLLAADGTRWDVLLVALPSGGPGGGKHGLEASEVAGFALALAGGRGALEAPKLASGAGRRRWPHHGGDADQSLGVRGQGWEPASFRFTRLRAAMGCILPRMVARTAFRRPTIVIFLIVLGALAVPAASATPRFHVECPFHHFNGDDPIVFPGVQNPPAGHLHTFLGNKSTNYRSTYRSLRQAGTNCGKRADKGAYWMPAVYKNGHRVKPTDGDFYYRGSTSPLGAIHAFPKGLKIIAGSKDATRPPSTKIVGWSCFGSAGTARPRMRDCGQADVKVLIHFPSCWDGQHTDSSDHKSHMRYSIRVGDRHVCPKSHPVPVPELSYSIRLPFHNGRHVHLSSGPFYTMHADFWNAWNQRVLRRLVDKCLHAGIECPSFEA
jgi:hypothetical protein